MSWNEDAPPAWLAGLKPGDEVVRFIPNSSPQYRCAASRVDRVTATQVVIVGRTERYRRDNGFSIGAGSRSDRTRLLPVDHPSVQTALRLTLATKAFQLATHYERKFGTGMRASPAELHTALIEIREAFSTASLANEPAGPT